VPLTRRLLLGALAVIAVLTLAIYAIAGGRLRTRLVEQREEALLREARFVALEWGRGGHPDSIAGDAGLALGRRVTIVDDSGRVIGDSQFDGDDLAHLENHAARPEIVRARATGSGFARRPSPSAGDEELYAAVRTANGFARVSDPMTAVDATVSGAQRDVLVAAAFAVLGALALAWAFAHSVSRPIVELRDVARAIAGGDLAVRPALSAPGEVGDLADALHRLSEQLAARLEALRQDEEMMTALVESLHQGIVAIAERGVVVRLNDHARRLLAVHASPPFEVDLLPRSPGLRRAIGDALAGTATDPVELLLGGRTLLLSARPLAQGGAVLSLLDLTELRRLELVRRDFVANVSHELKTPITVVRGFAETLLDDQEPPPPAMQRQFLNSIHTNAVRMQRIVDDLLDLSRVESGRWEPHPAHVELAPLVEEVFATVGADAAARGLALDTDLAAPQVHADPTALRQVLGNLVENAVRYTPSGRVTVRSTHEAGGVRIAVIDTGVGIPAEHLPRVFERFYRVDPARSRAAGGTGLGLAIVKHLVEAHGGHVTAESTVGQGTTIGAWFPVSA
jgi:signal transduction histidine kinase